MSIHILLGKPGSGKSLYATNRVLNELCETNRNIVTNLPLRLDRLNEYCQNRWPSTNLSPVTRIRLLTDDEMREFWKVRGEDDGKNGVAYFLDEAHIAFNAREWATLGKGALHYLSQHRKLGDIVWVITQAPGNLDKQFRSVAEDFTVLRNEYTAKWGMFRGRGRFVRRSYLSEPQANSEPFETASFTLDGVAECYDTAKGIGVHGSKADIGRRAKGIPILWVIPGFLVLASLCVVIPWALGKGAGAYLSGGQKGSSAAESASVVPPAVESAPVVAAPRAPAVERPAYVRQPVDEKTVWVTGYSVRGPKINVTLSDGRTLTEKDDLARVERNFVELKDGSRMYLKSVPPASPAAGLKAGLQPGGSERAALAGGEREGARKGESAQGAVGESPAEYRGEALFTPSKHIGEMPEKRNVSVSRSR